MTDDLLTIGQAARLAYVSEETIRYWIKKRRLATIPARISARSGKPYGRLVRRTDVLSASPSSKAESLKASHPGNLLTVGEISSILEVERSTVYVLVKRYRLEKVYLDEWSYLIDGDKLWDLLQGDSTYWHLIIGK